MDEFFEGPPRPARVDGRYRLPHPETGEEQSWTAATTHAELPEDSFALTRWQLRQLLIGLHRRPDLIRLVESWADEPDTGQLDGVISSAHEVAGNDAKANLGTAIHGVLQGVDRQWPEDPDDEWLARVTSDAPEWARPHVTGYVTELRHQGLSPVASMTERRVIHLPLGCAGTLDNLYTEYDGTLVLGDKKTGRLDYPERKYAIQLAVYQGANYLLDQDGGAPIDLRSLELRDDYAVLIHVDPVSGACSTYRVDLRRGRLGANVAADVRWWRRERNLLLPYVPPGLPAATGRHLQAVPAGYEATEQGAPQPDDAHAVAPGTHAVSGGLTDEQAYVAEARHESAAPATMNDLMRLQKAELQRVLRSLDPGASVAHQRKILAEKILTLQGGGMVATSTPAAWPRPSNDPAEVVGPIGGADPSDPKSPAFHHARLTEVAAASSVAELGRIHQMVVRIGGDQAWTDAMTEAARARTAVLDQATGPDPAGGPDGALAQIRVSTTSQEIAAVWEAVTVGGSVPERWTPELVAAAERRLAEVTAPAPTTNPYAGAQ